MLQVTTATLEHTPDRRSSLRQEPRLDTSPWLTAEGHPQQQRGPGAINDKKETRAAAGMIPWRREGWGRARSARPRAPRQPFILPNHLIRGECFQVAVKRPGPLAGCVELNMKKQINYRLRPGSGGCLNAGVGISLYVPVWVCVSEWVCVCVCVCVRVGVCVCACALWPAPHTHTHTHSPLW